ncbi:hypothetical protein A2Y47_02740 [Candidatus Giovannonibacteria bacterium RIFCSPLOWO2_12_43_8]|uniref:Uncharacterized protein n=1 Tax=Candidatus Giovannonibacteria bacterium RIFCSPLOWO2_12_43_8 TaxID=1798361 RepID=A0A1F5Y5S3_9BACT|nr:MAG: hypothetical protein A2Y47_02740 [Candidatus Giovannonibacteria bacterium RIFCSPLOWO2_12_43_8]
MKALFVVHYPIQQVALFFFSCGGGARFDRTPSSFSSKNRDFSSFSAFWADRFETLKHFNTDQYIFNINKKFIVY